VPRSSDRFSNVPVLWARELENVALEPRVREMRGLRDNLVAVADGAVVNHDDADDRGDGGNDEQGDEEA